jgi:hypothetical protein
VQFIILFGLAVAWGVLLVPDLLKKRGTVRSIRGVKGFDRQLSAFNRTSGTPLTRAMPGLPNRPAGSVVAFPVRGPVRRQRTQGLRSFPRTPADAQRRRIYVLATLFASALLTLAVAMAVSRLVLAVHFVIDLALASISSSNCGRAATKSSRTTSTSTSTKTTLRSRKVDTGAH